MLTCATLQFSVRWVGPGFVLSVGGDSPENVKDSGRMPMPNDVRPSKLENVRRTSSVNMVVQETLKDTRAYDNRVAKRHPLLY